MLKIDPNAAFSDSALACQTPGDQYVRLLWQPLSNTSMNANLRELFLEMDPPREEETWQMFYASRNGMRSVLACERRGNGLHVPLKMKDPVKHILTCVQYRYQCTNSRGVWRCILYRLLDAIAWSRPLCSRCKSARFSRARHKRASRPQLSTKRAWPARHQSAVLRTVRKLSARPVRV